MNNTILIGGGGLYCYRTGTFLPGSTAHEKALYFRAILMLIVGSDKSKILDHLPDHFLLIDDGEFTDDLKGHRFDYRKHSFNPLKSLSYLKARNFVSALNAIFPEGENTLTRKNSNFVLLEALSDSPKKLAKLIALTDDPAVKDAYQKIQTILISPVLSRVFQGHQNFFFRGTRLANLDRTLIGDFDAFVLGQMLIEQYEGTVVIPDYGFYAAPHHTSLFREDRLIAGVNYLDELPEKLRHLFLLGDVRPSKCNFDDAETLALEANLMRGTTEFSDFVYKAMH